MIRHFGASPAGRPAAGSRRVWRVAAGALFITAMMAVSQAVTDASPAPAAPPLALHPLSHMRVGQHEHESVGPPPEVRAGDPGWAIPVGRRAVRVPVLMYHYIRVNPDARDRLGFNLSVPPAEFRHQMDWLAANGYHPIDFADLRSYFAGQAALPSRPVILTFDDGYQDMFVEAWPVLRAHGFKAVSYVVTGFLGGPGYMTGDQVRELDRGGIQIGGHTVSHVDLTRLGPGQLQHELVDSKSDLERLLGHPVVDFCYPAGRFNEAVVRAVEAAGYQTATTTAPGVEHSPSDRLSWPRVRVSGGEPMDRFIRELGTEEPAELVSKAPGTRLLRPPVIFPLVEPRPGLFPTGARSGAIP